MTLFMGGVNFTGRVTHGELREMDLFWVTLVLTCARDNTKEGGRGRRVKGGSEYQGVMESAN